MIPFFTLNAFWLAQLQVINNVLRSPIRRRTQRARAANQNVITGNIGAVTTGTQTANPVNVG